jgi:hypothetical protein
MRSDEIHLAYSARGARMAEQEIIKVESNPGETKVLTRPTGVRGVDIYQFPWVKDPRGDLTVGQFESEFPFRQSAILSLAEFQRGRSAESTRTKTVTNF